MCLNASYCIWKKYPVYNIFFSKADLLDHFSLSLALQVLSDLASVDFSNISHNFLFLLTVCSTLPHYIMFLEYQYFFFPELHGIVLFPWNPFSLILLSETFYG